MPKGSGCVLLCSDDTSERAGDMTSTCLTSQDRNLKRGSSLWESSGSTNIKGVKIGSNRGHLNSWPQRPGFLLSKVT